MGQTRLQRQVTELSSRLPAITEKQEAYAFEKCFDKYAVRSRNTLFCLECGHSWKDEGILISAITGCTCPACKLELKMSTNHDRVLHEKAYFGIITTKSDMQVVRMFLVSKIMKKGKEPYLSSKEVMQHWIDQSGTATTMSLNVQNHTQCYDQWAFDSELKVRGITPRSQLRYSLSPYKIYPERRILPIIKRNGFKGYFHGVSPQSMFASILSDSRAETLLKSGQFELFHWLVGTDHPKYEYHEMWPPIKICIRHSYIVKDVSTWTDHVRLLEQMGKDTRNSKYVCPANLNAEHDRLVKKKLEQDKKQKLELMRKRLEADQVLYAEQKSKFFDLVFQDGDITVKTIASVEEFMNEGDELEHCVFASNYFNRRDSLILSARVNGQRTETVEVSLSKMEIKQCRGKLNKNTQYHDKIVGIVQKNINSIQKVAMV